MRATRIGIAAAMALMVASSGTASAAAPAAGWLDPSFADGGVRVIGGAYSYADADVAVGPTGRIYVLSKHHTDGGLVRFVLTAYTGSGRTVSTFNGGRPVVVIELGSSTCCSSHGPFPTADGGVVAGYADLNHSRVWKYTAAGGLDLRYGTGGRAMIPLTVSSATLLPGGSIRALTSDAIDLDPPQYLFGLTSAGAPDLRVGPGGRRTLPMHGWLLGSDAVARLYVAGGPADVPSDLAISRLSSSGNTDPAWGSGGTTPIPLAAGERLTALVVAPDGSVYVCWTRLDPATRRPQVAITKLTTTGAIDPAFGSGGTLVVPGRSGSSRLGALAVDGKGRLLVSFVDRGARLQPYLARFNGASGALDQAFGRGGLLAVANLVISIAPTADGKLLTVSRAVHDGRYTLILARRFN